MPVSGYVPTSLLHGGSGELTSRDTDPGPVSGLCRCVASTNAVH